MYRTAFLIFMFAAIALMAQTAPSAEKDLHAKCAIEGMEANEIKAQLEIFKKDCGKYPTKLTQLLDKTADCKNWGVSKGNYLKDKPANREMLNRFSYDPGDETYELKSVDCPGK